MSETQVACLTPAGHAAIAVLAVEGSHAWELVRDHFRPALPEIPGADRIWFGKFGEAHADEVVLRSRAGAQPTGFEIHCHGGPEVVRMLLELFERRGARVVGWPEFGPFRRESALCAEARKALAAAPTTRTAALLLDQFHGALERTLKRILDDISEGRRELAAESLATLASHSRLGRHLVQPWRVVLAGEPNVGKSTLMNALVGHARSIVSPTPGTTRDLVTQLISLDGWPIELVDTAGLRDSDDDLERQGTTRARKAAESADLCLWILDVSSSTAPQEAPPGALVVANKADLAASLSFDGCPDAVFTSAPIGTGVEQLCGRIVDLLVQVAPPPGTAIPFSASIVERIEEARAAGVAERWAVVGQLVQSLLA